LRIGVFCPNWVGDGVMALPFFNLLRIKYPDSVILAICKSWVAPVYQHHPTIDEIVSFQQKDLSGLWATRNMGRSLSALDLDQFYLLSDSYRAAYLAKHSETPRRIGYKSQGRSPLLTHASKKPKGSIHRYEYYLNLLGERFQNYSPEEGIGIHLSPDEIQWAKDELFHWDMVDAIAFSPFSVATSRTIPQRHALKILEPTTDPILIFGGKGDKIAGSTIEDASQGRKVRSIAGQYSLRQSMALIAQCKGAIAADSGLGHISANLGVPTVSLFGAADPNSTSPIGPKTSVINKHVHCSPCLKNTCHNRIEPLLCLETIQTDTVWSALDGL